MLGNTGIKDFIRVIKRKKGKKGDEVLNIFLRVLLAIYAFCLAILSLVTIMISLKRDIFQLLYDYANTYVFSNTSMVPRLILLGIALLFFIVSLVFLFAGIRSKRDKKSVSKQTTIGEVCISLNSIESISLNATRKIGGIRETRIIVDKRENDVSIKAKLIVLPETNIPVVSEEVQNEVKKAVEENAGIGVKDVKVMIDSVYEAPAPKPQPSKTEMVVKPRVE